MYCMNCGGQIEDGAVFCPFCGKKQEAAPSTPAPDSPAPAQAEAAIDAVNSQTVYTSQPAMQNPTFSAESYFDGGLLGMIGVSLVVAFVSFITLGFAWPAMWCYRLRWVYRHTVIGGRRLKFTGKGIQLFGKYLLWVFLSVITFTIYSWWIPIKYKKWEIGHVEFDA